LNKGQSYYHDLEKQYKQASANIEKDIAIWHQRFAKNNEISLTEAKRMLTGKELKEFKWDVNEYIKYGEKNAENQLWMKELENASARVHVSRLEALKIQTQQRIEVLYGNQVDGIDHLARNIYQTGYYHTAYEIQRGLNVGYDLQRLNDNQLTKVISKPWTADNSTFTDKCWTAKQNLVNTVHTELTQSIIRGDSPDKAIKTIAKQFDVSKNKAGRLVMTESAFFASAAQNDAFKSLDVERFEVVATLDNNTSQLCQGLDGHVFVMKDYQIGVTAPPFHPWCRTCTVPFFEDDVDGERAARGKDGSTYYVPSTMKYKDWQKTFVDGGPKNQLKEIGNNGTMKTEKTFKEKIQTVKDAIISNGGKISESDIQQAGKVVQDELKMKRFDSRQKIDSLQRSYKDTGIADVESELNKLRQARRGLIELDEVGMKDMDSLKERYESLMSKKFELNPIVSDLENKLSDAKREYKGVWSDNTKELKEKLSEIRGMGSGSIDVNGHLNKSRSPMKKVIVDAYDNYPTEWVQKSVSIGTLAPKKVDRGYYSHHSKVIAISGNTDKASFGTAIHELGHRFERTIPGIKEAEKLFYERRTAGDTLQWLGSNYDRSEKSRFDKFLDKYIGKDYGGSAYELVSMGFQYAYLNPTLLWEDEDFATWIYGILVLH